MTNESYLLHQERCPSCAERGNDTSGDNLGVYSDGHSYCYRCGYYSSGSQIARFLNKDKHEGLERHHCYLPNDCDVNYPQVALDWIGQYELNRNDLLANNSLWSESKSRLYFPVYGPEGLLAYQGRYFGNDVSQKKWWGKGDFRNIFAFFGKAGRSLVLVEDVISAIKVSRFTQTMWLSGNSIGKDRWRRLYNLLPEGLQCIIWLDPDMYTHSIKESKLGASYGVKTTVILSTKDPKECSYENIKDLLAKAV